MYFRYPWFLLLTTLWWSKVSRSLQRYSYWFFIRIKKVTRRLKPSDPPSPPSGRCLNFFHFLLPLLSRMITCHIRYSKNHPMWKCMIIMASRNPLVWGNMALVVAMFLVPLCLFYKLCYFALVEFLSLQIFWGWKQDPRSSQHERFWECSIPQTLNRL